MKKSIFLFAFVFIFLLQSFAGPKFVFLFIGDGTGIAQRMLADEFMRRETGEGIFINTLPNRAITITRSANSFITDSAASGTAIATGKKTNNGWIGMSPTGERLESVATFAKKQEKKVGIISTVTINHATPASFYGFVDSRKKYYQLGLDLIYSNFDYFAGGGIADADDSKHINYKGNLYDLVAKAGYTVVIEDNAKFKALKPSDGKVLVSVSKSAMKNVIDKNDGDTTLADLVAKGIELLDNPKGFFMMAEGGQIDTMCHRNDGASALYEAIDFDNAVKVAYEFYKKHPDDTLIVVTADHETGGLTLGLGATGYSVYYERLKRQKMSAGAFEKALVSLAQKEGEAFNIDKASKFITENFGLKFEGDEKSDYAVLNKDEIEDLSNSYKKYVDSRKDPKRYAESISKILREAMSKRAGIGWTTTSHTAHPIDTSAIGAGAEVFNGQIDNTDIAIILKDMMR